jgi:hypothetical protein
VACAIRIVGPPWRSTYLCEPLACFREVHPPRHPRGPYELLGPPRSQKVKVRWLDGEYEGPGEWVPKVRLVAPWDEAEAYKVVETVFVAIPQEAGAEVSFGPANGTGSGMHRADLDKNTHDSWAARRKPGILATIRRSRITKSALHGHYHNAERAGGGLWRLRRKRETGKPRRMGLWGSCRRRIRSRTNCSRVSRRGIHRRSWMFRNRLSEPNSRSSTFAVVRRYSLR